MHIYSFAQISSKSFGSAFIYKNRYIPAKQDPTIDIIRTHLEDQMGPQLFYYDQLIKEKLSVRSAINIKPPLQPAVKTPRIKTKVNAGMLKGLNLPAYRERRPNELYSGGNLAYQPEKLKGLKEAGIKSVLCLVNYPDYKENVEAAGLNFIELNAIKGAALNVFDINGDLIKELINHPESYADDRKGGKVTALKEFVKILNGENEEMPLPLYFGCQNGTDRTFMWYQLYNILKNEPMDKPLSPDAIAKLAEFRNEVEDYFRW